MKLKSMDQVLAAIKICDVIIKNGQEQIVCLYYDRNLCNCPIVLFKSDWCINFFLLKALELMPVPCVEHKLLARALFEKTKEGDYIDAVYMQAVAKIYSNLCKFKDEKEDFEEELNKDIRTQLYELEAAVCKRVEKKFWKNRIQYQNKHSSENEVREQLQKCFSKLVDVYDMDYKLKYNTAKAIYEYYLEPKVKEYNLDLWLLVMLSTSDQKIYVGNSSVFHSFEMNEVGTACEFVKTLTETTCNELIRKINKYCEEFKINPRLYAIAENSIKTMLEMNFNSEGIEFGFHDTNKTAFLAYLRDRITPSMMYEVCISYNEFIRNPEAFKQLIEEPRVLRRWNFWSRRKKYREELFDERFSSKNEEEMKNRKAQQIIQEQIAKLSDAQTIQELLI